MAPQTAHSLRMRPRFTPGRGGSSSPSWRAVWVVCGACSLGPRLRPILPAFIWVCLGPWRACMWSLDGPPGIAVTAGVCACDGAARGPWIRLRRARGLAFGTLGCSSGRVPRGRFWARIVSGRRVSVTQSASRMGNRYYMSIRFWEALGGAQRRRYGSVPIHFPRKSAKQPNVFHRFDQLLEGGSTYNIFQ